MKRFIPILLLATLLSACNSNAQNKLKRYNTESGIVKYEIAISGKVMGSTISGKGTEELYFKDYGAVEVQKVESSQTTTAMKMLGMKNTETEHTLTMYKLDKGTSYTVDFDQKVIHRMEDMAMNAIINFHPEGDAEQTGRQMMESMGGEKTGIGEVLGYECETWLLSGVKQWVYKGVPLKLEATIMGITTTTTAVSAQFDVNVPASHFKLPDFPIQKQESPFGGGMDDFEMDDTDTEDMKKEMQQMKNMSFTEWKKLVQQNDEEMRQKSDEELRQIYDMMQKMLKNQ